MATVKAEFKQRGLVYDIGVLPARHQPAINVCVEVDLNNHGNVLDQLDRAYRQVRDELEEALG